ncbi:hypothetical protein [Puniceibacterium confluentis]|uniref:hypothetical protein n=1 Tax=Puniceibacterium confluentis TaxID=1958944 RepID=UPI0011B68C7D|nr:hypothetical protein [Puniceibacterium confluentis]
MKQGTVIAAVVVAVLVVLFGIYMIDFDVAEEGALPDVDVSVEGGKLPDIDAEVGTVTTGSKTVEVEVPTIDVDPPKE